LGESPCACLLPTGCSSYITKPVDFDLFVEAIQTLGRFLKVVAIPPLSGGRPAPSQKAA
jgi:hypothetical protein